VSPAITSPNNTTFIVGQNNTFTVTDTGTPTPTLSETGALPQGVMFTANTGVLSGKPTMPGTYTLTFTADNGVNPNATQTFTLQVNQAPAITSPNNATFIVGLNNSFTVTATGTPAPTLSESGALPQGVTFNANTGVLSGIPIVASTSTLTFTATNNVSPDATQTFTLQVNPAPAGDEWTGANFAVDNNWSDPANWSLGAVPGTSDIALFTNNASVSSTTANVDVPFTVAGVTIDSSWGGTVNVNKALTVSGNFSLASGTVDGNGVLSMAGSGSSWSGGILSPGTGGFSNSGTLTLSNTSTIFLDTGTLTNTGTITQSGSADLQIQNKATLSNVGTYDITADSGMVQGGSTPDTFSNSGILEKTGGSGTSTIAPNLDNTGTMEVLSGTVDVSGTVTQVANNSLGGGTWEALSSATTVTSLDISSGSFTTIGSGAIVTLSGGNATFTNLSNLATIASGGTFNLLGGQLFSTSAALTNSGTLDLDPASVLTVNGAFTQTATGTARFGVGGTASSETFGQITSTGQVTLAGKLGQGSKPSYIPPVGSAFEFIDNESGQPISGTFTNLPEGKTITLKVGTKVLTFKVTYKAGSNGMSMVLTRIS
jgi:hypothetical protein